ncbi:sensor histidine kinase [Virgisporangium aurantiacum]|uniref:histidine kinase n=1 Tax=Virgisporangium aurantiacum TaxID=175570 RepID=A0A8J4DWN2_9ACTN|nr:histidine kinase [Virgisporangium aurantiacum]GIJ53049.1 two-component sensor histidine kinase [Virgisporangium aurantiacum]
MEGVNATRIARVTGAVPAEWSDPTGPRRDVRLALICFGGGLLVLALDVNSFGLHAGWWRALPLLLVCLALLLRRIAPLAGLCVGIVAGVWDLTLGPSLATWLVFGQLAYDVALYGRREVLPWLLRASVASTVVATLGTFFASRNFALGAAVGVTLTLVFVVPVATSVPVRQYRERAERERERAEQIARLAELSRRQALADERARMARELHDVVANHLSAVAIHATAAQSLLGVDPSKLADILGVIRENSVQGLAEMRRMVEVLREPGDDLVLSQGLVEALPRLAAASSVDVTVERVGEPRPLPPDVDHAAYRIVQESLTNAGKHAPGGTAAVRLEYLPASVVVTVDSSAPASAVPPVAGAGMGLRGMRERVTLLGGEFSAGPPVCDHETAWRVRAELPS